ncbi:MAG: hypothetical protein M4D80_31770 [Myxococcota bacterium]|nr:hypothetical protein [Myxococcota bacterium]
MQFLRSMKATVTHPKNPVGSFRALTKDMPKLPIDEPRPLAERMSRPMSVGTPSKPVLGLPLARIIPMDCHSFMDYGNGLVTASTALATDDKAAQLASITLASLVVGVSVITDYRVSIAKILPIEVHEVADYVWGASAIALPFVLGYWKTSPKVAVTHIFAGIGSIVGALITDYRAYSKRSQTAAR